MKEYAITFDPERCIACHGCVVACKTWRDTPQNACRRRLDTLWTKEETMPRLRHASVACLHCNTPACLEACPAGAIRKQENGLVAVDEHACIGCRACLRACPFHVPSFAAPRSPMIKCDLCNGLFNPETESPPCVASCPTRALTFTTLTPEQKNSCEARMLDLLRSREEW